MRKLMFMLLTFVFAVSMTVTATVANIDKKVPKAVIKTSANTTIPSGAHTKYNVKVTFTQTNIKTITVTLNGKKYTLPKDGWYKAVGSYKVVCKYKAGNALTVTFNIDKRDATLDFTLIDLNSRIVHLSDYRGKKVLINFWNTWCIGCVNELPFIENISRQNIPNFVILTVACGNDIKTAKTFVQNNNYHFTTLIDESFKLYNQLKIETLPITIFINKNGTISRRINREMTEKEMKVEIGLLK